TDDAISYFAVELLRGKIGALKGLGGYPLSCDARSEAVVAELRRPKHREEKPFTVMVTDLAAAKALSDTTPPVNHLLLSPPWRSGAATHCAPWPGRGRPATRLPTSGGRPRRCTICCPVPWPGARSP